MLNRYFVRGGDASQAMIKDLGELKTLIVAPSLPSIQRSLEALKDVRMGLGTPVTPKPQQQVPEQEPVVEPVTEPEVKDATPQALNEEAESNEPEISENEVPAS